MWCAVECMCNVIGWGLYLIYFRWNLLNNLIHTTSYLDTHISQPNWVRMRVWCKRNSMLIFSLTCQQIENEWKLPTPWISWLMRNVRPTCIARSILIMRTVSFQIDQKKRSFKECFHLDSAVACFKMGSSNRWPNDLSSFPISDFWCKVT